VAASAGTFLTTYEHFVVWDRGHLLFAKNRGTLISANGCPAYDSTIRINLSELVVVMPKHCEAQKLSSCSLSLMYLHILYLVPSLSGRCFVAVLATEQISCIVVSRPTENKSFNTCLNRENKFLSRVCALSHFSVCPHVQTHCLSHPVLLPSFFAYPRHPEIVSYPIYKYQYTPKLHHVPTWTSTASLV
jgi:hypothetical protein